MLSREQGPRSYFESAGRGGGLTSDSKWGGAEHFFLSNSNFQKSVCVCGGGGGAVLSPSAGPREGLSLHSFKAYPPSGQLT